MKRLACLFLTLILFGLDLGHSLAGEEVFLARLEWSGVVMSLTGDAADDLDLQLDSGDFAYRLRSEFSRSEVGDEELQGVRGKAIGTNLPRLPEMKTSGIILWDETKTKALGTLRPGQGENLNYIAR
jgi:hypothetical protein